MMVGENNMEIFALVVECMYHNNPPQEKVPGVMKGWVVETMPLSVLAVWMKRARCYWKQLVGEAA
jgi:hypothetical protein